NRPAHTRFRVEAGQFRSDYPPCGAVILTPRIEADRLLDHGEESMMNWTVMIMLLQVFFSIVIGLYFWNLLRNQQSSRSAVDRESRKEMDKLRKMRSVSLTEPLSEKTRPSSFDEIVGQREGLRALKAAL